MIKTTRSRLEIRQEPGRVSAVVGFALVAAAGAVAAWSVVALATAGATASGKALIFPMLRVAVSVLLAGAGWFFLRMRARLVLDLDHRMVVLYKGVGGRASGGNQSWDLAEFSRVVLRRGEVVCLRRADGTDLELYWSAEGADQIAARIAGFTGLPYS